MAKLTKLKTKKRLTPSDREQEIIDEAVQFFAEVGFGGRTRDLAKRIGITQPLLYRAEAIRLGEESGLDLEKLYQVISSGAGTSKIFELRAPMMIEREYLPATMKMDVWSKDMSLIREMINDFGIDSPDQKGLENGSKRGNAKQLE